MHACRCRRFVKFEGVMGYLGVAISFAIMSVRCGPHVPVVDMVD
jgi:hypothetical protein